MTREGVFCFQAEDGIRDDLVTGVQTCALPIFPHPTPTDTHRTGSCDKALHRSQPHQPGSFAEASHTTAARASSHSFHGTTIDTRTPAEASPAEHKGATII